MQYGEAARNIKAGSLAQLCGATATLKIMTGPPPASCAAPATGTVLCSILLPSPFMTDPVAGFTEKTGTWAAYAIGDGLAGYFRFIASDGATCVGQGTISADGGGGEMTTLDPSIVTGQEVIISSFSIRDHNG